MIAWLISQRLNVRLLSTMSKGLITVLLSACASTALSNPSDLPTLGDASSEFVSLQEEHQLGRLWLRQLRTQAPIIDDPISVQFLENLIYRLVPHSNIQYQDFEFVIIDSKELNAFAVPGGIIGINLGILLYSRDEDELSAVLAHELAHLSQRHFARRIEQSQRQEPATIAALLASILLIASNNAEAGFAGLLSTQAAAIQNQLAYSRDFEREADRLGMRTLVASGLDPHAMSSMFKQMLQAGRFQQRPPEFLLTHPVTEGRVADAADRAQPYPAKPRQTGFEFTLLKYAAQKRYQIAPDKQRDHFEQQRSRLLRTSVEYAATLYTLAQIELEQSPDKALGYLKAIPSPWQKHPATIALHAQTLQQLGKGQEALALIKNELPYSPSDYTLLSTQAELLLKQQNFAEAVAILKRLTELRPSNPTIWTALSKAAHLNQQKVLELRAISEAMFYNGKHSQALRQMELALRQAKKIGDFQQEAALRQRLQVMSNSPSRL